MADLENKRQQEDVRVLILEDNPADAEFLEYELKNNGSIFSSKLVETRDAYIEALRNYRPDIILSDYDLPGFSGQEALQIKKEQSPETPFILVSGVVTEERAIEILTGGATDYVLKKNLSRLLPAVQRALQESSEHKRRKEAEAERDNLLKGMENKIKERTAALQTEILERKKTEEELRESRQRYKELVNNANSIIIRMDQNGSITFFNEYAQRFFGYSLDEILGKDVRILLPHTESDGKDMEEMVDDILKNPDDFTETVNENVRKNGERIWVLWKNKAIRDGAGNIIGNLAIGTDITGRKQAEEKLRESTMQLHLTLQVSAVGTFEVDLTTGVSRWNAVEYELLGLKPGDMPAGPETFFRYVHPQDIGELRAHWEEAMKTGHLNTEFRVIRADGQERWLAGKGQFMFAETADAISTSDKRQPLQFLGVNFDITASKQAEDVLRQKEALLNAVTENNPDPIFMKDRNGRLLFANPATLRIIGKTAEEAIGKTDEEFYDYTDEKRAIMDNDRRIMESGQTEIVEEIVSNPDGSEHFFVSSKAPVFDGQGQVVGLVGVAHDITRRKQAEEKLQESEVRFRTLTETSPLAVGVSSFDGRFLYINKAYEKTFGFTLEELNHINASELWLHPEDRFKMIDAVRENGILQDYEAELKRRDGTPFWASITINLVDYGSTQAVMAAVSDITERRKTQKLVEQHNSQLQNANKELEVFTYFVSHDLRAPLRAIDGYSRMIGRTQGDNFDEETKRQFDLIRSSAKAMGQLIDDLLTLSRLSHQALSLKTLDMRELMKETFQELQTGNAQRQIHLKTEDMPQCVGDRGLIKQVLVNLTANAFKFTRTRKKALIEAGGNETDREIVYYVKDNGIGFDMEYRDKMFEAFQRLQSSSDYEGTGIGLAIVQRIIQSHGGRVWAEGKVGKGATFYFSLPKV